MQNKQTWLKELRTKTFMDNFNKLNETLYVAFKKRVLMATEYL